MTNLTINDECLKIATVKRKVEANIDWLLGRIARLDKDSAIDRVMLGIYAQKMHAQRVTLEWLSKHDRDAFESEPSTTRSIS